MNFKNLSGNTYGDLYVIRLLRIKNNIPIYECRCKCGNICEKSQQYLLSKQNSLNCGCNIKKYSPLIDLTGQTFGDLTVLERADDYIPPNGKHESQWKCECSCGNICIKKSKLLRNGKAKNCGDPRKHNNSRGKYTSHSGYSKTRLYGIWERMILSCYNSSYRQYTNIGGRGIKVCDDWRIYNNFYKWSYENEYDDTKFLNRAYYDIDFCPENCYYSNTFSKTRFDSLRISRLQNPIDVTQLYRYQGNILTIDKWIELSGYPREYFINMLSYGYSIDYIMATPPEGYMKNGIYMIDSVTNQPVDINKYIYMD